MTDPAPETSPPRSRVAAALVVLLATVGVVTSLLAWALPATRGGAISSLPGWVHTLFPVLSLALCTVTGIRFARPGAPASGRDARILLYGALLAVIVQTLQFSPFVPAAFFLALSTGLAIGGGLLQIKPLVGPGAAFVLDLCVGTGLLLAVGTETGLRFLAWNSPGPLFAQADASPETRVARRRLKPGQLRYGFPASADGFQDAPLPEPGVDPAPVVVLGDEALWGVVPHAYAPTSVAERALGQPTRPVVDLALPDLGPADYWWLCRQVALPLRPAAVVIALDPYDDLQRAMLRDDGWRSFALLFDRQNVLITSLFDRAMQRAAMGRAGVGPQAEAFRVLEPLTAEQLPAAFPWLEDPTAAQPTWSAEGLAQQTEARARLRFDSRAEVRRTALLDALVEIASGCAREEVPCAVLLIPGADRIDPGLRNVSAPFRNERLGDLFDDLVADLRARQIPVLDATPTLRAAYAQPARRAGLYQEGDLRLGPRGAELLGEAMAALLAPILR